MEKAYNPNNVEDRIYKMWQEKGYFSARVDKSKKVFSLVIPPPNITGILHMGHVLDNTPQDIMVRFKRMQGHSSCWVPGTDHAGIATQNAVERKLAESENLSRHTLGRERFVERIWQWKEQFGETIIQQLKKLGCSCDWQHLRFTMDNDYSNAVKEVFIRLYEKGLVYRGNYIINWCPRCLTALSDEEVEYEEVEGGLYWIRYPLAKSIADTPRSTLNAQRYIVVATTRPETMLGDTAVAVNPQDNRYKEYLGKTLILPIVNREIPIITDEIVEKDFGSGAVKVTPAHDPNDFLMGQKHNLAFINVMAPDAKMNENAGEYKGLDRLECRKRIINRLSEEGLLEKQEKYLHSVGHCYRCETMIEPYLSTQWFVRMKPLTEPAIKAVAGDEGKAEIQFYPSHWTKVYLNWLENIRDWCISRQLWWGHRIPVWYCQGLSEVRNSQSAIRNSSCPPIASRETPNACPKCGSTNLVQDEDVLDTWFSSWLWPFVVFGWPEKTEDLEYFYPTSVLNSGKDILFFWVARMIMAGYEFTGRAPFRDIYIHGIARDSIGRKLSKSLGNSPDPLNLINKYGADALRFGIMANIPLGGDINLSDEVYESGRNFCNKLWNASRLVLTSVNASDVWRSASDIKTQDPRPTTHDAFEDRWILIRLNTAILDYTRALETYEFSEAAHIVYHFFWGDLCDWYLEIIKPRLYSNDDNIALSIIPEIFSRLLKLLHPYIPFITEELWQKFREKYQDIFSSDALIIAPWPEADSSLIDLETEKRMGVIIDIIRSVRNIRNKMNIDKKLPLDCIISAESDEAIRGIKEHQNLISQQTNLKGIEWTVRADRPSQSVTEIVGALKIFVPLEGIIDVELEKKRLQSRLTKVQEQLEKVRNKLDNKDFTARAPQEVIQKETAKLGELSQQFDNLQEALRSLSSIQMAE
ncbi:MAG: valine--tRNA ligase [Planctomycetota bacterium]|nr:valine--tRNA ligase [Planctomycetota bacterium]MDI6786784.1 valine--tRNA ligase [Planctomycetota bacterium]